MIIARKMRNVTRGDAIMVIFDHKFHPLLMLTIIAKGHMGDTPIRERNLEIKISRDNISLY